MKVCRSAGNPEEKRFLGSVEGAPGNPQASLPVSPTPVDRQRSLVRNSLPSYLQRKVMISETLSTSLCSPRSEEKERFSKMLEGNLVADVAAGLAWQFDAGTRSLIRGSERAERPQLALQGRGGAAAEFGFAGVRSQRVAPLPRVQGL